MSKFETMKKLASLGVRQPSRMLKAIPYTAKYGIHGLHARLSEIAHQNQIAVGVDSALPGAYSGSIKFSVLMPTYNVEIKWLAQAIRSVSNQTYSNWELCLVDDCSTSAELKDFLVEQSSDKVKVKLLDSNTGISNATNLAATMAEGDYLVLLDNDDLLDSSALFELYLRASSTSADVIYTDNNVIDENNKELSVLYKPDWSPELLLSQMYIGHLLAFKKELFDVVGGFRKQYDGSQDYDLMLRMSALQIRVEHIPKVLYSWRSLPSSTAENADAKPYAQIAGKNAIQDFLDSKYGKGYALATETSDMFVYDVRYSVPDNLFATIVIPTKDHFDDLRKCVDSIRSKTSYRHYEIIIVNNNTTDPKSLAYLEELKESSTIKVLDVPIPFNWSKLNNLAADKAKGDVLVFLNNDTEVLEPDWLTRLIELSIQPDIAVVGGLLLYPDGTIQHAGVVAGMGGWADHVYKGCNPIHYGNPYISPMVTRNVIAVTGACMAISKTRFAELDGFNENFIVCGSDVELCINAYNRGYRNVYSPHVKLLHHESKTRDASNIPEVDFKLSGIMYRPYRTNGDPYFNRNLDPMSCAPKALSSQEKLSRQTEAELPVSINETRSLVFCESKESHIRLNLLVPSINPEDIYGGISTALSFFERLQNDLSCYGRVITLDAEPRIGELEPRFARYTNIPLGTDSHLPFQIVSAYERSTGRLPVSSTDWFICTSWWSAACVQNELSSSHHPINPIIYLIQDFEPGFYPWSTQYMLADATYKSDIPTLAIFNSPELHTYFQKQGYSFYREFSFTPSLNTMLKKHLLELGDTVGKRKQILLYGRPETSRNAFSLIVEALRIWINQDPSYREWEVVSAGESHLPVYLGNGRYLTSLGKLNLDQYAQVLSESYLGISLMASPHPSYPPLEMAAFGIKVITNQFANKDLSDFCPNIVSIPTITPIKLANTIQCLVSDYKCEAYCGLVPNWYLNAVDAFPFISELETIFSGH